MRAWLALLLLTGCADWFDGVDEIEERRGRVERLQANREISGRAPAAAPAPGVGSTNALFNGERRPKAQVLELLYQELLVTDHPVPDSVASGPNTAELPAGMPAFVGLVVLDTVRADHLGICGYERPTSPVHITMRTMGGAMSCGGVAPGTWTLPTHATLFTGVDPFEHTVHRKGVVLPDEATTLAETLAARGYQTLAISANPVLKEPTGLMQGFQRTVVASGLVSPLRGETLVKVVKAELARLDDTRPVFLFLNIFDAHEPYPAVPEVVDWLPVRPAFAHHRGNVSETNPMFAFLRGTMPDDERDAWLAHAVDSYDFGAAMADRNLGRVLKLVQAKGLIERGVRLVVTSDHGENLGDHGALGHDGPPWESVSRVPFLYVDSARDNPLALPDPMPVAHTFHLLAEGGLDPAHTEARAVSLRYGDSKLRYKDAAAVWGEGGAKAMWLEGTSTQFDLTSDPGEEAGGVVGPALAGRLTAAVEDQQALKTRVTAAPTDEGARALLEAVGYVDE